MGSKDERIYTLFFLPDGILDFEKIVPWSSHTTLKDAITVVGRPLRHEIKKIGHLYVLYREDNTPAVCIIDNYIVRHDYPDKGVTNADIALERTLKEAQAEEEEYNKRWSKND